MLQHPRRWLLLRGLIREQRHWYGFDQFLGDQFPEDQIDLLDHIGFGTERMRRFPISISAATDDARRRWLDRLSGEPDVETKILFAISLGGMIAMYWLSRYPDDFDAAVIVNTSARNVAPPWKRMRVGSLSGVLSAGFNRDPIRREKIILELTTQLKGERLETLSGEGGQIFQDAPVSKGNAIRQLLAASFFSAPKKVSVPMLFLASENDRLVDPISTKRLAGRYDSPLKINFDAGHDLSLDAPEWTIEQLKEFLDQLKL